VSGPKKKHWKDSERKELVFDAFYRHSSQKEGTVGGA
jgi:hypothetical protein